MFYMKNYAIVFLILINFKIATSFYTTRKTDDSTSDLRKIAIHRNTGEIYVGGKNALLRFNSKFENASSISFRRKYCVQNQISICGNATAPDDIVEVLEYLPEIKKTLMCGSLEHKSCNLLSGKEISPLSDKKANYIDSRKGSILVPIQKEQTWIYFIGTSWDGGNSVESEFSFKKLYNEEFLDESVYSKMKLCDQERRKSNLKFIYGFQDEEFVYSIYLKIRMEDSRNYYETKLSRICKNDDYMGSFSERILSCNQHNIATAAYYLTNGTLYVAFGTGSHSLEALPSSVVCMLDIQEINKMFTFTHISCYSNIKKSGYTPPRWNNCEHRRCNKDSDIPAGRICTNGKLRSLYGIESIAPIPGSQAEIYRHEKKLFTSVFSNGMTEYQNPLVWIGTNDGFLLKVGSTSPTGSRVYVEFDLTKNRSVKIEPDVEIVEEGKYAYILYGNKVSKFPLDSCQIHTTCGACVLSGDPLGCGWCKDVCLKKDLCKSTWYNDSCPPFIHEVFPTSGPTEGGTVLTLKGRNFGSSNLNPPSISVGKTKCENVTWNDTNIQCVLPMSKNFTDVVIVKTYPQNSTHGYKIKGDSEIGIYNFSFKVPIVMSVSPTFGPRHGNTIVTITGENLDIGSKTSLSMCKMIRINSSSILCKINECLIVRSGSEGFKPIKQCPYCDDFVIEIDNFKFWNKTFCYKPNPVVQNISRTSTMKSGGLRFKISGRHFGSVHSYVFRTIINSTYIKDMNCTQINGTEIICKTPNLSNISEVRRAQVVLLLEDDAFYWKSWNNQKPVHWKVYQDPHFNTLRTSLSKEVLHDTRLELKGRNLDGLRPEDIVVTLDEIECPVIDVQSSLLKCDLTTAIERYNILERDMAFKVEVSIGNLRLLLGDMTLKHQVKLHLAGNKTVIPISLISFFIVLLIICAICMKVNRIGPFKRKILHHESSVVFQAENHTAPVSRRLLPDPDPESSTSARLNDYVRDLDGMIIEKRSFDELDSDFCVTVQVLEKQNLLIDGDNLRFDRNCGNLGRGNFGCVYKAFLRRPEEHLELTVAVKTIIRSSDADVTAFLNEALIMKDFNHPNVLTLIGITLDKGEFPMVILPFMQNGSLLSYIRNENNMPTVKMLVTYGLHIARGMEYMAENKFVHRDLAARNCMLDSNFIVKVADFGLTRDVYSKQYYSSENKERLPVKWMAPESLEQGKYSAKSDVWSYGVLLWELMTRGAIPYPEVDNWDVCTYIKTGRRLQRPEYCPPHLYRLMRMCWQENPMQRPPFSRMREEIEKLLDIKGNGKMVGDTQVDLERCTNYHYMDEVSLARQRSLSTKWSTSSEDAALL
ncbi:hepatocyte growth factor receptor-like [Saccostrea echinata]|uniref:hepatocyte growth factor receptor-like n=1 Tax=Saccostrea echinata TaxID=191078 RepID=UPI002A81DE54|nr:hepatocyte growth factor receptor-like [Saccostrea echinata]